ncbi:MAG: mechanosensitive ion channel domain-containing protein [Akkermansiaceae bacterium]
MNIQISKWVLPWSFTALIFACLVAAQEIEAQNSNRTPVAPSDLDSSASSGLSIEEVEKQVAAIKSDSSLQDTVKQALIAKYESAIQSLKQANANLAFTAEFDEVNRSGAQQTEQLKEELGKLPAAQEVADLGEFVSTDQLNQEIELRRVSLNEIEKELERVEADLTRIKGRPIEVAERLPRAQEELKGMESSLKQLGDPETDSPNRSAERVLLQASIQALTSEIEMLGKEQSSQIAREARNEAQRDLLLGRRENQRALLASLGLLLQEQRLTDVERLSQRVEKVANQASEKSDLSVELILEFKTLLGDLEQRARMMEDLDAEYDRISKRLDEASEKYRRLQEQVILGGLSGTLGQTLIAQYRSLASPQKLELSKQLRQKTLREVRLESFRTEEKIIRQQQLQERAGTEPTDLESKLLEMRSEVLVKLQNSHREVADDLLRIDSKAEKFGGLVREFREYLNGKLFWTRSSRPISSDTFRDLPSALGWFFSGKNGSALVRSFIDIPKRHPFFSLLVGAVIVALLVTRGMIAAHMLERGKKIRRISSDRYSHTLAALGETILLTLPIPIVIGFLGWTLVRSPDDSGWLLGIGLGFIWSAGFLGFLIFLRFFCRPSGLAISHFNWDERIVVQLRSSLLRIFVPYTLLLLVTLTTLFAEDPRHLDSLGRLSFVLAQLYLAVGIWRLLRPSKGLFTKILLKRPHGAISRTRFLWFPLAVGLPLGTSWLALTGYILTAYELNGVFLGSLGIITLGSIVYSLILRWFTIKERRMALAEAIEERRTRREAQASGECEGEDAAVIEEVEQELDLNDVSTQTRRLLRSLMSVFVLILLWWYWEKSLPIDELLDGQTIGNWISFLRLVQVVLVATVSVTVVRNLPGLLDLAGFRESGVDAGTRYAVATIAQYSLVAISVTYLARILGLDWSQFGWIAAALGVGLGFGLQEIVANFVCGIILLFERPIRRGDIVTLEGVTGTVSRIQMRATTITNWQRQDYVVPNKQLITGSLVNWTLLNSINRIELPVGVAYGSDTGRAMQLLSDVAKDHPLIMEDPAPLVSFDSFGDSTLDLMLRAYLPDMDNRLGVITALNSEIDRRFKEAGIEIAFPQRDLHVRSIDPSIQLGGLK